MVLNFFDHTFHVDLYISALLFGAGKKGETKVNQHFVARLRTHLKITQKVQKLFKQARKLQSYACWKLCRVTNRVYGVVFNTSAAKESPKHIGETFNSRE